MTPHVRSLDPDDLGFGACCESGRHAHDVQPRVKVTLEDGSILTLCAPCYSEGPPASGCPCLLQHATSPRLRIENGRRILSWTCGICGEWNTEVREDRRENFAQVLHGGPLADSLMGPTVRPS